MESALMMVLHSIIIGGVIYFLMTTFKKLEPDASQTFSVLIAAVVLIYMIVFGHNLPSADINPHLKELIQ